MYRDQPHQLVQDLLHETLWPDHPLGRPLTGTPKSLDQMHRRDLLAFLETHYTGSNTWIVVAGPLRHGAVVRAVRKISGHFRSGPRPAFVPAEVRQTGPLVHLKTKAVEQTQMAFGLRACSCHDERRHGLRVLNAVLGENMSSRLFQILREDKGLAYSIYSSWAFLEETGAVTISAGLDHDDLEKSLRIILRELRRFREVPVGAAELRRTRDYLIGQMELSLEGTENQMNWVAESLLSYGRIISPAAAKERLARVTTGEVRRAAQDFFSPDRFNLALISPLEKTAGLKKILHGK